MSLSTEQKSIESALKLKHYKDFCIALDVLAVRQADAVKGFRTQFNTLHLQDSEEKEWVLTVTAQATATKSKNVSDSLTQAVALRKELPSVIWSRVREVITSLGGNASDWLKEFGPNPNLVDLRKVAAIIGQNNASWIHSIPEQGKKPDLIVRSLEGLTTAKFSKEEIIHLWENFKGLSADLLWAMVEETPSLLYKAGQHLKVLGVEGSFWMTGNNATKNKQGIRTVTGIVYKDLTWMTKPTEVNQMATRLVLATGQPWINLFTIGQLLEIQEKFKLTPPLSAKFFSKAGTVGPSRQNSPEIGKWLCKHCDLIARLADHNYSDQVILAMFDNSLNRRLIIQSTWFSQITLPSNSDEMQVFFRVTNVHGGLIGRRNHLAKRHLYAHFDFKEIKPHNSFHPRETSAERMAALTGAMVLPDRNSGMKVVGDYCVVVGDSPDPEKRLVISLYPNLADTHPDRYTQHDLDRIKKVVQWIKPGNVQLTDL